jgi:hypothetical protein
VDGRNAAPNEGDDGFAIEEKAVRAYLRVLAGAPVRQSDSEESSRGPFIAVARSWAERVGVDGATLLALRVDEKVLASAGIAWRTPSRSEIRRRYTRSPFTAAILAERVVLPEWAVRSVLMADLADGRVEHVSSDGEEALYRKAR